MNILTFDEIDSTNDYVKTHSATLAHLSIIRARYQHRGRGQLTRRWIADKNANFLFTLFLKDDLSPDAVSKVEQCLMTTCITFLKSFDVVGAIKLPNDILVNDKKIAGMLIETRHEGSALTSIIAGLGFNINQILFPDVPQATSLRLLTKKAYDIDALFHEFITILFQSLHQHFVIK
jgi:BirA family biotin operon repressor/biotin-[acetyl-CoA-carboxylase] ligase